MANATASRLGVVNGASPSNFATTNNLFLKVFAGEVLTAFDKIKGVSKWQIKKY